MNFCSLHMYSQYILCDVLDNPQIDFHCSLYPFFWKLRLFGFAQPINFFQIILSLFDRYWTFSYNFVNFPKFERNPISHQKEFLSKIDIKAWNVSYFWTNIEVSSKSCVSNTEVIVLDIFDSLKNSTELFLTYYLETFPCCYFPFWSCFP